MKRGQASNEALMIIGFMTFILIIFLAVISNQFFESGNLQQQRSLSDVADLLENEIGRATASEVGYYREFDMPLSLTGARYEIEFFNKRDTGSNFSLVVLRTELGTRSFEESRVLPGTIEGQFLKGTNVLQKRQLPTGEIATTINSIPVAYWKFDNAASAVALDSGRYDMDGALSPTCPSDCPIAAEGVIGTAYDFDGSNDYVLIADHDEQDILGPMSVSAWVFMHSYTTGTNENRIFIKGQGWYADNLFTIDVNADNFVVVDGNQPHVIVLIRGQDAGLSSPNQAGMPEVMQLNTWYHLVGVYDESTIRLYANGVLVDERAAPAPDPAPASAQLTNGISIGGRSDTTTDSFDGIIDEVKLFNVALTESEVLNMYELGKPDHTT